MISITQTPETVNLQGLPIVFKATSNKFDEPYFQVMAEPVANQFDLLKLNRDDEAVFDLREYFKPELSVNFDPLPRLHANACKEFEVNFYDYYGNPPVQVLAGSAVHNILVLLGTVPEWKQLEYRATYANFAAWRAANVFLTWYPAQPKRVLINQPEVLYFLAPASSEYAVSVAVLYTDNSIVSYTSNVGVYALQNQVASVPVGYTALAVGAQTPSKKVVHYTVTIAGKTRTYIVDHTPHSDVRYIIFRTSLGGYDVLQCTGEVDSETEMKRKIANRVYDPEASPRISRYAYNIQHTEVEKVNTGWLLPNEKRWLNDLLISEDVWEMLGGVMRPVMIRNSNIDRSERSYEPGSVELEYERLTYVQ
jgi:hypothetical protein